MILIASSTDVGFFADIGLRTLVFSSGLMACESTPLEYSY